MQNSAKKGNLTKLTAAATPAGLNNTRRKGTNKRIFAIFHDISKKGHEKTHYSYNNYKNHLQLLAPRNNALHQILTDQISFN